MGLWDTGVAFQRNRIRTLNDLPHSDTYIDIIVGSKSDTLEERLVNHAATLAETFAALVMPV